MTVAQSFNEYVAQLVEVSKSGGFPSKSDQFHPERKLYPCLYRGPNGRRCVAGLLISDSRYKSTMEGHPAWLEDVWEAFPEWAQSREMCNLIWFAQQTHDELANKPEWDHELFLKELSKVKAFEKALAALSV
jgi:hypothetical protein